MEILRKYLSTNSSGNASMCMYSVVYSFSLIYLFLFLFFFFFFLGGGGGGGGGGVRGGGGSNSIQKRNRPLSFCISSRG